MSKYTEFQQYVLDQLAESGDVHARKMFGGVGVYVDEIFCAILSGSGRFYLRVDDGNRQDFIDEGMEPFPGRGDSVMPYHEVPTEVVEDSQVLGEWLSKAQTAARNAAPQRKRSKKTKKKARKPKA